VASEGVERRLAAILAADVVGYSRLMGDDEAGTLARLKALRRELIDPAIANHRGRIFNTAGDGLLAEFANAMDAVAGAVEMQRAMAGRNAEIPEQERIVLRIGVNLGDVIVDGDDIHGNGVNVAARLEGLAEPGGLLISQKVHESIDGKLDAEFADNGKREFKNIAKPIRVWSWPRRLPTDRRERKPFVVIADFEGRSEDELRLAEDLRDELAAALSRLTGLEVTRDRRKADYSIHGGVRLAGQRCRLSARLIGEDDEKQLWAERYDEDTDDAFDILDRCVPRMAMSVRRRIASDDAAKLAGQNLDEMTLEHLLSTAGVSFFTPTREGWLRGGQIAELALEREPTNFMALAMAAVGVGMVEIYYGFRQPDDGTIETAFARIEEARRQTSKSDMLIVVYSGMLLYGRRRHDEAVAAAERALELNPEFNMGLWALGAAQAFGGKYAEGIDAATRAVDVDIRDPYVHLYSRIAGYGYYGASEFQEAAEWFWKADQLAPGLPHNLAGLAASQWHNGDREGARGTLARLLDEEPEFRIRDMMTLPYRDVAVWERFLDALRAAGAPE
jgi:class 3 adenylate cyclase